MLLGPDGNPVSTAMFKKADPPKLGPVFGDWAGRDITYINLPGGSVLTFDLSRLTLSDYRAMRHNPQINSSLAMLSFMIHQIDWWIECDDKKLKDLIETNVREKWSQIVRGMSQAYWCGYSPCVIEWENNIQSKSIQINRVKDLLPEDCRPHWKVVDGWAPPGEVKPKFKKYDGIVQGPMLGYGPWHTVNGLTASKGREIPVENTLWYPLLMENGDYAGRKLLKPAFTPWYFSTLIHLFANRYYERFGEPTPVGRAPLDQEFDMGGGQIVPAREGMFTILENLRSRGVVVLPSDRDSESKEYEFDIDYLESNMRGVDFDRYLTRLDEEMSLGIFTPILMFKTGAVGSNNLGVQHAQTFLWLLNALAADFKEYMDAYVVDRMRAFNAPGANSPKAQWMWKPMGKENAETLRGLAVELVRGGRAKPSIEELGKGIGLTMTEIKQVTAPSAPPPATDPNAPAPDPNAPAPDPRTGRARPEQAKVEPRGVGKPRATGRNISARVAAQVTKAFANHTFGTEEFKFDLGYRRQMINSFQAEGWDDSEAVVDNFYGRMSEIYSDMVGVSVEDFDGPNHFMTVFNNIMDAELERLADG